MKYYYVKLSNLPRKSIHRGSLEFKCSYNFGSIPCAYLNINGRLCHNLKFAICDSEEKATKLLEYWKPQLDNREYGSYTASIESGYANKCQQRYLATNTEKLSTLLASSPICNKVKKTSRSKIPTSHLGVYLVEILTDDNQKYYISTFKNDGGYKAVSYLSGAGLYKNKKLCLEKIAAVKKDRIKMIHMVPLTSEQLLKIQNKFSEYY